MSQPHPVPSELLSNSAVLDALIEGVLLIDREKRVAWINRPLERLLGIDRNPIHGSDAEQFVRRHLACITDEACTERIAASLSAQHDGIEFTCALRPPGGRERRIVVSSTTIRDEPSRSMQVIRFQDVTGWKQAEDALRKSEEKYRTLFESAGDALLIHDLDGRLLDVNRATVERLGYSREELLAMDITDITPPEFAALVPERIRTVVERGNACFETTHVARDGRCIFVEASARVIPYRGATAILSIYRDITRRKQAVEALRESEEKYRSLFNSMQEGLFLAEMICDDTGRVVDFRYLEMNRAAEQLTGLQRDQVIGRLAREVIPSITDDLIALYGHAALTGEPFQHVAHEQNPDRYYENVVYRPAPGQVAMLISDVTRRIKAEEALRRSEERFRLLTENASDVVLVLGAEGRIRYASPSVKQIGGYAPEDLVGRMGIELVHPGDLTLVTDSLSDALARPGERIAIELRVRHASGDWLYLDLLGVNLLKEPAVQGFVINARDITDRKRAEEVLRQGEQSLAVELDTARRLQQVSTQLILADRAEALYEQILDTAVTILHADFASIQMLDADRGPMGELRLLGHRGFTEEAARFWEWVRPDSESSCGKALSTGQRVIVPDVLDCEFLTGSADGEMYLRTGIRAAQTTPLYSRSGTLLGMLSTHWRRPYEPTPNELRSIDLLARQAADLIDRKRAEDALRRRTRALIRKSEELEAAHDTANMYLDIMTHDVRNANNVSSMYADLLVEMTEGNLKACVEKLHASIDRSTEILRNVATIRRAQEETGLVPVDLDAVIREEIATFSGAAIQYTDPEVTVLADGLLPTVFANLIGNAVKYGGPAVVVTVRVEERDGEVLVSVEDTGPGVPDAVKGRLFTRFERGMARGSGQGLGLFIVRTLVERYGGRVWVEDRVPDRPEEGAAFRFTLKTFTQQR